MPDPAKISVIVRAHDEAAAIGRCLQLVGAQQVGGRAIETIVVDSGSRDGTEAIAAANGARVISTAGEPFSFGGALNRGAAAAAGEILVALSAHAFPLDDGWLTRLVATFDDPQVACACGDRFWPDGTLLAGPVVFDRPMADRYPLWGYSNAAGAFRASLWRERPFREDLPACEDREWCRHWVQRGHVCVLDPTLLVDHDHTHDPVLSIYRRARREAAGFATFMPPGALPPVRPRALAIDWWSDTSFYGSPWRARLSHRRFARLLGTYVELAWARRSARVTRVP